MNKEFSKTLKEFCSLFLNYMFYTKKISSHTLRAYTFDLKDFFDTSGTWGDLNISSVKKTPILTKKDKKEFEQEIKKNMEETTSKWRKLSASSKGRKLASLRSFIRWLSENEYIEEDFRHLFKAPKTPVKIPNFLSVDEIFIIIRKLREEKDGKDIYRDRCLFFLLYGGGLRVGEACHLQTKHIDWENKVLKIKGKGGKERLVVLPMQSFEHLKPFKNNKPYLFGEKPLSVRKAYDIIRNLGRKSGILKPLHPHALRHSFATHLLSGGSDLRILQELLGHKSLMATQKYTHLDLIHLSKTLEKHHPIHQKEKSKIFNFS